MATTDRTYVLWDAIETWAATETEGSDVGSLPIDSVPNYVTVRSANLYLGLIQEPIVVSPWNVSTLSAAAPPSSGTGGNGCF